MKIRQIKKILKSNPPMLVLRVDKRIMKPLYDSIRSNRKKFGGWLLVVMPYPEPVNFEKPSDIDPKKILETMRQSGIMFMRSAEVHVELPQDVEVISPFSIPLNLYKKRVNEIQAEIDKLRTERIQQDEKNIAEAKRIVQEREKSVSDIVEHTD